MLYSRARHTHVSPRRARLRRHRQRSPAGARAQPQRVLRKLRRLRLLQREHKLGALRWRITNKRCQASSHRQAPD